MVGLRPDVSYVTYGGPRDHITVAGVRVSLTLSVRLPKITSPFTKQRSWERGDQGRKSQNYFGGVPVRSTGGGTLVSTIMLFPFTVAVIGT